MKSPGIYRIYCKATKRNYVGSSTKDWANRRNGHMHLLRKGKHPSVKMQEDWNKYGAIEFAFILICECPPDRVSELENLAAIEFKAFCPESGYNTAAISTNRFNAGRKASGKVRFCMYLKPERAQRLAAQLKAEEGDGVLTLERGSSRGIKFHALKVPGRPSAMTFNPKDNDFFRMTKEEVDIMKKDHPSQMESPLVIKLQARIKELEAKIKQFEQFDQT